MKLVEELKSLLDLLYEKARKVSDVENKVTGLWYQVIKHLIKLYQYQDPYDRDKHIRDLATYVYDILEYLDSSKSPVSERKLRKWFNWDNIDRSIKIKIRQVHNRYTAIRPKLSDEETIKIVKDKLAQLLPCLSNIDIDCVESWINQIRAEVQNEDNS